MVLMLMQWVMMMWLVIEHRWGQFIETWLFPWRRRRGVTWAICPIQLRELALEQRRLKLHRSELFPRSHGRTVSTTGRPHGRHGLALVLDTATAAGLPHVTPHIIMICIIVTTNTVWRPFAYKQVEWMDGHTVKKIMHFRLHTLNMYTVNGSSFTRLWCDRFEMWLTYCWVFFWWGINDRRRR